MNISNVNYPTHIHNPNLQIAGTVNYNRNMLQKSMSPIDINNPRLGLGSGKALSHQLGFWNI